MSLSDEQIVRGCQASDVRAFEALLSQFTPLILRRVSRLAVPSSDRADVCQEVLAAAYTQLGRGSFHGDASLATWLHQIATGKAIDYHRRNSTRARAMEARRGFADFTNAVQEQEVLLAETVASLPWRERLIFVQFYFRGAGVKAIAGVVGLSASRTREILTKTKAIVARELKR